MRVGRQTAARVRLLLPEPVELVRGQAALEVRPGVDAGGGVALEVDLVAAAGVVLAAEEVVQTDLVQRRHGRVRGDVAADAEALALGASHHDCRVPADPRAIPALHGLVTREVRLLVHTDGVHVGRRHRRGDAHIPFPRPPEQVEHDVPGAGSALVVDQPVEGLDPFLGLGRVDVRYGAEQTVDQRSGGGRHEYLFSAGLRSLPSVPRPTHDPRVSGPGAPRPRMRTWLLAILPRTRAHRHHNSFTGAVMCATPPLGSWHGFGADLSGRRDARTSGRTAGDDRRPRTPRSDERPGGPGVRVRQRLRRGPP